MGIKLRDFNKLRGEGVEIRVGVAFEARGCLALIQIGFQSFLVLRNHPWIIHEPVYGF